MNGRVERASKRRRREWIGWLLAVLLLTGCSDVAGTPVRPPSVLGSVTFGQLKAATGDTCTLPGIAGALTGAGLHPTGGQTGELTPFGGISPPADGVLAACTVPLAGGSRLVVSLFAAAPPQTAILVALPFIQQAAALNIGQLRVLVRTAASAPGRTLLPLPGTAPVAVAPVTVSGAGSAALVVSCTGCTRAQVEAVASFLV